MNSHRKSDGKYFPFQALVTAYLSLGLVALFLTSACSIKTLTRSEPSTSDVENTGEISLKEDREHLAELRKEIPKAVQQENDKLSFMLNRLGSHVTDEPNKIRSKFDREVRKKRDKFRKKMKKVRDRYTKEERKKRDRFVKTQKSERKSYLSDQHTSDERKEFFAEQADKRKEFFEAERIRRKEFESEMSQQSNDFNAEMREAVREFYQEWDLYSRKYRDEKKRKKQEDQERSIKKSADFYKRKSNLNISSSPELNKINKSSYVDEFEQMKSVPSTELSTGDQ